MLAEAKNNIRHSEVIYQIYPATFNDSNGDGHGDLKGITQKLDYVKSLGVNAIWISPFFLSPEGKRGDGGYAITDYKKIDPKFGTMKDFDELLKAAHQRHLHVYTDFVLCHTADDHEWFSKSVRREPGYENRYVWSDGKKDEQGNRVPPNNWLSVFGGSAWEYNDERKQYYLHHFNASQPALNLNDAATQDAMLGEMKFWLDKGVDGLRLDALPYANHDPQLRDNPVRTNCSPTPPDTSHWEWQHFKHSMCQPETVDLVAKMRREIDERYHGGKKLMGEVIAGSMGGTESMQEAAKYLDPVKGLHSCYTDSLIQFEQYPDGRKTDDRPPGIQRLRHMLKDSVRLSPDGRMGNSFSNHDFVMAASRMTNGAPVELHGTIIRQLLTLGAALPGDWYMYMGEELGKRQDDVPPEKRRDMLDPNKPRDGSRTPMMWDSRAKNAGFSASDTPYYPVSEANRARAVDLQEEEPKSLLNFTRRLIKERKKNPAMVTGATTVLDTPDPILAFVRQTDRQATLFAFNMSQHTVAIKPSDYLDRETLSKLDVAPEAEIVIGAYGHTRRGLIDQEKNGNGHHRDSPIQTLLKRQHGRRLFAADMLIADNHITTDASVPVKERGLEPGQKFTIDEDTHRRLSDLGTGYTLGGSTGITLWTLKKLLGDKVDINFMGPAPDNEQGALVKNTLKDAGINLLTEQWPAGVKQDMAVSHVIGHPSGQRSTMLTYPGAEADALREIRKNDSTLLQRSVGNSDVVYLPGSMIEKYGLTFTAELLKERWEQQKELVLTLPNRATFGPDDTRMFKGLIASANVVMGSDDEFCRLYGFNNSRPVSEEHINMITDKIQTAFREKVLANNGMPCPQEQVAFVTRGKKSALLITADKVVKIPPARIDAAGHPLGVGDATFAGFLAGYFKGLDHENSARIGMALAAEKMRQDTASPHLEDPQLALDKVLSRPEMSRVARDYRRAKLSEQSVAQR